MGKKLKFKFILGLALFVLNAGPAFAFLQECGPGPGQQAVGQPCNSYGSPDAIMTSKYPSTCDGNYFCRILGPLDTCEKTCLDNHATASGSGPWPTGCTDGSGNPGTCSCGAYDLAGPSAGFPSATCNPSGPPPPPPPPASPPCYNPYSGTPGSCVLDESRHRCDKGNGSDIPASNVSSAVKTAGSAEVRFTDVVNKKLACCMNDFDPADPYPKFDCVDNSKAAAAASDFNSLWSSTTDEDDGTMSALFLTNPAGKPITGFYTLSGARCDDYSEFATSTAIQPYKIDPNVKSNQQNLAVGGMESLGAAIAIPSSKAFTDIHDKVIANNKKFPDPTTDRAGALRCPILVRAALVAACPATNSPLPIVQKMHAFPDGGTKIRCSAASSLQVHIRIEQLYEITGQPKLKTIDTVSEKSQIASLSIERLLIQKIGTQCPTGTTLWNDVCKYP